MPKCQTFESGIFFVIILMSSPLERGDRIEYKQ